MAMIGLFQRAGVIISAIVVSMGFVSVSQANADDDQIGFAYDDAGVFPTFIDPSLPMDQIRRYQAAINDCLEKARGLQTHSVQSENFVLLSPSAVLIHSELFRNTDAPKLSNTLLGQVCEATEIGGMILAGDVIAICTVDQAWWDKAVDTGRFCASLEHEVTHIIQNERLQLRERNAHHLTPESAGPFWLKEGLAEYYELSSTISANNNTTMFAAYILGVEGHLLPDLSQLESYEAASFFPTDFYKTVLASTNLLIGLSSETAVWDFYECIPSPKTWYTCFEQYFSMPVSEFYEIWRRRIP